MQIAITRFHLPRGRQEVKHVQIDNQYAVQYESIIRHECRITEERLLIGVFSVTIEHEEGDFAIVLGQELTIELIEKLLNRWDATKFEEWLKAMTEEDAQTYFEA